MQSKPGVISIQVASILGHDHQKLSIEAITFVGTCLICIDFLFHFSTKTSWIGSMQRPPNEDGEEQH